MDQDTNDKIRQQMAQDKARKMQTRSLIDSTFPQPAQPQPSHEGSQSQTPTKEQY